ncbi:MAG: hypothetical protein PUE05_06180 [bacterium]|nr:hypothetical protein [bacterium]
MMKHLMKIVLVAILSIASSTMAMAQKQDGNKKRLSREQLAEKMARNIAKKLAFTDAQTQKFVDAYSRQQKEIWALGENKHPQNVQERLDRSEKILSIRKKYYKEYASFLSEEQVNRVYDIDRRQKKHVMEKNKKDAKSRRKNAQKEKAKAKKQRAKAQKERAKKNKKSQNYSD